MTDPKVSPTQAVSTGPTPRRAKASAKSGGSKKISRRLVVLGATSILAVWAAGYAGSSAAAQASSATAAVPTISTTTSTTAPTGSVVSTGQYQDGIYAGQGTSRHGSIQVQVVVRNGQIASANITQSTTRYPTSQIASLPGLVVARQNTNVDLVTGATDSSSAYLQAVDNALAQAV